MLALLQVDDRVAGERPEALFLQVAVPVRPRQGREERLPEGGGVGGLGEPDGEVLDVGGPGAFEEVG
ncbi:MAG TPA: hypothetical protein VG795_06595 [Acidimicrobiia bacterium]|nr:hypothetical protein [Acidimicrobiia bacterium]